MIEQPIAYQGGNVHSQIVKLCYLLVLRASFMHSPSRSDVPPLPAAVK